jgi:ATP-dependent exoDNAse (exonuclease V) beta subunit
MELLQRRRPGPPDLEAAMKECALRGVDIVDAARARWVFPALLAPAAARRPEQRPREAPLPPPQEVAAQAEALHAARARARAHAARPFGEAASAAAHEERLAGGAERRFDGRPAQRPGDEVARAVGSAIHRVLEEIDFEADPGAELARQRAALETLLAGAPEPALEQARELLDRIVAGSLFAKLRGLAGEIRYRELPVLVPPEPEAGPVGYVSGVVDLVYRDPETQELVIADYKTDRLDDEARLAERSQAYRMQGAVYQKALRGALELPYQPRFELWYLHADEIRS